MANGVETAVIQSPCVSKPRALEFEYKRYIREHPNLPDSMKRFLHEHAGRVFMELGQVIGMVELAWRRGEAVGRHGENY